MEEPQPGPSSQEHKSIYSNNQKVSIGMQAKEIVIHGPSLIDQRQITSYHTNHTAKDKPIGPFEFSLDDIPNLLASRNVELELMHQTLQVATASTGARIVLLVGTGGAGKTTLAKLYARSRKDDFDNLVWMDAETEAALETTFKDLIAKLYPAESQNKLETNPANISRVHNRILKHKTLWVFDNVEDFTLYKKFAPKSVPPKCHPPVIIVTTRITKGWTEFMDSAVNIERINLQVCEQYIRLKLGGTAVPTTDIDQHWAELAEYTGGLVIALNAAVTLIVVRNRTLEAGGGQPLTIANFLARAKVTSIQDLDDPNDEDDVREIYGRLRHLWTDTLNYLPTKKGGPLALRLLNLMAYFPPTGVPTFWFKLLVRGFVSDEDEVVQSLALLVSWSLADKVGEKHAVHRVLQEAVLRRANRQDVEDFLKWILPALNQLYYELRMQGKLVGYYSGIESFLQHFGKSPTYSFNEALIRFCAEALEKGVHPCSNLLKTYLNQRSDEQVCVSYDTAIALVKNWNNIDNFPIEMIKLWLEQFEAESTTRKIQLITFINEKVELTTEVMEIVVQVSQYFEDAICSSQTSEEISTVSSAMNMLIRFVCHKYLYCTHKLCDDPWHDFVTTSYNVTKATLQILKKFSSLGILRKNLQGMKEPTFVAAETILLQFGLLNITISTSRDDSLVKQQHMEAVVQDYRNQLSIFVKSTEDSVTEFRRFTLGKYEGGFRCENRITILERCEEAIAAKIFCLFRKPLYHSMALLLQVAHEENDLRFDCINTAIACALLYAIPGTNLDKFLESEPVAFWCEYTCRLPPCHKFLEKWARDVMKPSFGKEETVSGIQEKVEVLQQLVAKINDRLVKLYSVFANSLQQKGFSYCSESVTRFGYNSSHSYEKLQFWIQKEVANELLVSVAEYVVNASVKEQKATNITDLYCQCYPAKYRGLLAELYFKTSNLTKAIAEAKIAFDHKLSCKKKDIYNSNCTHLLIEFFHKTEDPSPKICQLLTEILDSHLVYFGDGHIVTCWSYIYLVVFFCLEGDVQQAVDSLSKMLSCTEPEKSYEEFSEFIDAVPALCVLVVNMLLWRRKPEQVVQLVQRFGVWFENCVILVPYLRSAFDVYKEMLHFFNAIALYKLHRISDALTEHQAFNFTIGDGLRVPVFWFDILVWFTRISFCFDKGRESEERMKGAFKDLRKSSKKWLQKSFVDDEDVGIFYYRILEHLVFSEGMKLTENDWHHMITCHEKLGWSLQFKLYKNLAEFDSQGDFFRQRVTSGELLVACLINEYNRGTFSERLEESRTQKCKCVVL